MITGSRSWHGVLILAVLAVSAVVGGCSHTYDMQQVQQFLDQPRPLVAGSEYRIMPPDTITFESRRIEEIGGQQLRVRPDGKVNLPLLGEIFVAGKTPSQVEQAIVQAAGQYYENPDATVQVTGYNSQSFFVMGQVGRRGPQPWTGNDTVLDALSKAGMTQMAWPERIVVIRPNKPARGGYETEHPSAEHIEHYQEEGVHPDDALEPTKRMTINVLAMIQKGDMANNILLQPNDIIYVQPNPFAKVTLDLRRVLMPLNPIVEALSAPGRIYTAGENVADPFDEDDDDDD